MRTGEISIGRRVGFKLFQMMFTCQTVFISYRTLDYATAGTMTMETEDGTGDDDDLDWDIVPMMLIFTACYLVTDILIHLIFDVGRELNSKVYNEILKLRGNNI